jgi:hypothetical protein
LKNRSNSGLAKNPPIRHVIIEIVNNIATNIQTELVATSTLEAPIESAVIDNNRKTTDVDSGK